MTISGNLYVYNQGGYVYVKAENCGQSATLSHNVFASKKDAETLHIHDDHVAAARNGGGMLDANNNARANYGGNAQHGVPVPAGSPDNPGHAGYRLANGIDYGAGYNPNGAVKVGAGKFLRVGFRGIAFGVVQIPPEGQVTVVSYADLTYRQRNNQDTSGQRGPRVAPSLRGGFVSDVASLMMANQKGVMVNGQMRIVPRAHPSRPNELMGWEVWFENLAPPPIKGSKMKTGFTGTIVLTDAGGEGVKNAGLGLESMAVPEGSYSAMQFIRAGGNYGVEAQPGTHYRAGIRGYSHFSATLPALNQGEKLIPLSKFEQESEIENEKFFDPKALKEKMGEKKNRVRFYQNGQLINAKLPETIFKGMEAFQTADTMPPRVQIEWVEDDAKYKGGGWLIRMTNSLPADPNDPETCADELGKLSFTGTLKLRDGEETGRDFRKLRVHKFEKPGEEREWFLPKGTELGGMTAETGRTLEIGTRGTGWLARIDLPNKRTKIDTAKTDNSDDSPWELWETQHERARMYPDYEPMPELDP